MGGWGEGGAYLIYINNALTLSLIDLVVKNEGGGEGLNNFLLLKKGGLIKEGAFIKDLRYEY